MPDHPQVVLAAYREWLTNQPLYEVESLESHFSRFWDWYNSQQQQAQPAAA